jgi:hypothetical protein
MFVALLVQLAMHMRRIILLSVACLTIQYLSIMFRWILRWIFRKWEGVVGTGWRGLRIGTGGVHL